MFLFLILLVSSDIYDEIGMSEYMNELESFNGTVEMKSLINNFNDDGKNILKKYHYFSKLNLLFIGKQEVGKKTLINEFFRWIFGQIGIRRQITQRITEITKRDCHLTIYNTVPLESAKIQQDNLIADISYLIKRQMQTNDPSNYIHCIFYCVKCVSNNFDKDEEEFLQNIKKIPEIADIPIILVLTQSYDQDDTNAMIKKISQFDVKVNNIIPIVAKSKELKIRGMNNPIFIPSYGMDDLQDALDELMVNYYKESFGFSDDKGNNDYNISIRHKRNRAYFAVGCVTLANFLYSLQSNPNALVYITSDIGMIVWISSIYGIKISKETVAKIVNISLKYNEKLQLSLNLPSYGSKIIKVLMNTQLPASAEVIFTAAMGVMLVNIIEDVYVQQVQFETVTGENIGDDILNTVIQRLENL